MILISFVVYGRPQPAGSKRAFKHPSTGRVVVTDDAKGSRPWKQQVAGAALDQMNRWRFGTGLYPGPLTVELTFTLARPKGHYGSGRNADHVKPSAPAWPTTRPDVDKLSRACLDAMTGVVWRDDAQVVRKTVLKRYGTPEGVAVLVRDVDDEIAQAA